MELDEIIKKRVVIINIGSSTSHEFQGHIFPDGAFAYVPIPEGWPGARTPTYRKLGLAKWVTDPDEYAHYDPEFETMTFGDYENKPRTANARKLETGDFLFFFASLSPNNDAGIKKDIGFYLIGYFEMLRIIPYEEALVSRLTKNNAHVKRIDDHGFSVWKGTNRSSVLHRAVPIDRTNADLFLRTSKGEKLPWGAKDKSGRCRKELETINSATRASRLILPEHRREFWKAVRRQNRDIPIFEDC